MRRQSNKAEHIARELARKPGSVPDTARDALLYQPRERLRAEGPEPVDVSRAIGRAPREWEAELITEARLAERARELVLFDGVSDAS